MSNITAGVKKALTVLNDDGFDKLILYYALPYQLIITKNYMFNIVRTDDVVLGEDLDFQQAYTVVTSQPGSLVMIQGKEEYGDPEIVWVYNPYKQNRKNMPSLANTLQKMKIANEQNLFTLERAGGMRQKRRYTQNLTNVDGFLSKHGLEYPTNYWSGQFVSPQMVVTWLKHDRPSMFASGNIKVTRGAVLIKPRIWGRHTEIVESYYLTYVHNPKYHMYNNVSHSLNGEVKYSPGVVNRTDDFFTTLFGRAPEAALVVVEVIVASNKMISNTNKQQQSHENLLILNFQTRTAEYFEPHGYADWTESVLQFLRTKLPLAWSFDVPTDTCPALQQADPGYCTAWSCLFLIYRMFHPNETREQLLGRMLEGGRDKLWTRIGSFYGWAKFWQDKDLPYIKWRLSTQNKLPWHKNTGQT